MKERELRFLGLELLADVEQVTVGSYSIRFRVFNIFSASAGLLWIGAAVALVF